MVTINDFPAYWKKYFKDWSLFLENNFGLADEFSERVALFLLFNAFQGNSFKVLSGYRSASYQAELRKRWDAGDRSGLAYRPASQSLHSYTTWLGFPASEAVDLKFNNQNYAGRVAPYFGISWGGNYRKPDPNHFYNSDAK